MAKQRCSIRKVHMEAVRRLSRDTRGQALVETAMFIGVLSILLGIMANLAYLVYTKAGVTSASRQAALSVAQGIESPRGVVLPAITTACAVAANEISSWSGMPGTQWSTAAASSAVGGTSWANTTQCAGNTYSTPPDFKADPEANYFSMNAITTNAGVSLPVNMSFFGGNSMKSMTLYGRTVYMRQQN